eukprot:scpid106913/ scgid17309/ 
MGDRLADDKQIAEAASTARRLRQLLKSAFSPEHHIPGICVQAIPEPATCNLSEDHQAADHFANGDRTPGSGPRCWNCQQLGHISRKRPQFSQGSGRPPQPH